VSKSLIPWQPKELTLPGLRYIEGAGLPSGVVEAAQGCLIDAVFMDNGMPNRAKLVMKGLGRKIGATVTVQQAACQRFSPLSTI
jgi:putative transposase